MLRRTLWLLAVTLAGCTSALTPGGGAPAVSPMESVPPDAPQRTLAPETVIDGYTIGQAHPDCPISNPECAKILNLVKIRGLDSPSGRAQIADCSLSEEECLKFTGQPQREGFSKDAGMGELIGLAEDAMVAEQKGLDPATIVGFHLYSESLTPYIATDGHWLAHRTGGYTIVVFDFADGSLARASRPGGRAIHTLPSTARGGTATLVR